MKFGVVVFPGSNCDHDCYYVLKHILGKDTSFIWHEESNINHYDCIILPGGFSYGDYLRAGAIARFSPVIKAIENFALSGGLVIGICNGFQVLTESGLLPGALMKNRSLKFICKNVYLKVENPDTPFTNVLKKGDVLKIPIAHGEGNYFIDKNDLDSLIKNNQIVFRYSDENGKIDNSTNPNGSVYNIAGICNKERNILGMMPHPERCSEEILGNTDGKLIFYSIIKYLMG